MSRGRLQLLEWLTASMLLCVTTTVSGPYLASAAEGSCGPKNTCADSNECCSQYDYCGSTPEHCGAGCKSGPCLTSAPPSSAVAGACRPDNTCADSNECCSQYGFCGVTSTHCGTGCKSGPCLKSTSPLSAPPLSAPSPPTLPPSAGEGACRSDNTCANSNECCSQYGFCGTTPDHCGTKCKSGPCLTSTPPISAPPLYPPLPPTPPPSAGEGACRPDNTCANSDECCSQYGFCGTTPKHCSTGCKSGPCLISTPSSPTPPAPAGEGACRSDNTCANSNECCSQYGFCGTTPDHCGTRCKSGPCLASAPSSPKELGACGSGNTCVDSNDCCSQYGFCGTTSEHCGSGCKSGPCVTSSSEHSSAMVIGLSTAGAVLFAVAAAGSLIFVLCRRRRLQSPQQQQGETFDGLKVYSYAQLRSASSDFRDVLGGGGSADVFRAELDGRTVAVKRLKEAADHGTSDQEFTAEARGLGQMIHVNLVRLIGYSNDRNRPKILVYEFIHGGSLSSLLYGESEEEPRKQISFDRRLAIALGIARGIEYCHHSIQTPLIHRDIKPANVLMTSVDETGIPKVADFGLARMLDPSPDMKRSVSQSVSLRVDKEPLMSSLPIASVNASSTSTTSTSTSTTTASSSSSSQALPTSALLSPSGLTTMNLPGAQFTGVAGTYGYIDPEYLQTSRPTLKSDVYSFGVVLLELIVGSSPLHILAHLASEEIATMTGDTGTGVSQAVAGWTYEYHLSQLLKRGEAEVASKVSSWLGQTDLDPHQCFEAMKIAYLCLQDKGKMRPDMRKVVRMLEHLCDVKVQEFRV